jgi:hypothetical protein
MTAKFQRLRNRIGNSKDHLPVRLRSINGRLFSAQQTLAFLECLAANSANRARSKAGFGNGDEPSNLRVLSP